jgi:tetratricopeptide (TPR) repeat protein
MIVPPPCFTVSAKSIHFAVLALSIAGFASHTARATDEHAPAAPSVIPAPAPDAHAPAAAPAPTTHAAATPTDGPEQLVPVAADVEVKSEVQLTSASVSPKEAQGLINLGLSLTDRGDYDAAEIAYRRVMNGDAPIEHTKSALLGLARMHRKKSELTKAAAIYERYLKDYQGDDRIPDALLELGRTLRDMGAPRLAIARFYNVINSTLKLPSNSGFEHYQLLAKTAQFEVAETHFQSGDYVEANKFFSRLRMLDLAPGDRARAHFKAAYSLHLAGESEAAVTSLRTYIDQWADDEHVPEARHLLALTLRSLNRQQEALACTLELLRAEKTRSEADAKRWSYWQRRTGNQLANEFFQGGDILNALAIYHGLAALSEDTNWRIPVAYQIALCYERLSDSERAGKMYQSILDTSAAKGASADVTDIARMASSRLAHMEWRNATDDQVSSLFDSTTGQTSPSAPALLNDPDRSTPTAPATL